MAVVELEVLEVDVEEDPPLGVNLDNSIGGGKPLEVAEKSDKLTIEEVCWDLGVLLEEEVVLSRDGFSSELGMSWILVGRC